MDPGFHGGTYKIGAIFNVYFLAVGQKNNFMSAHFNPSIPKNCLKIIELRFAGFR
jgi:hypothetical protein